MAFGEAEASGPPQTCQTAAPVEFTTRLFGWIARPQPFLFHRLVEGASGEETYDVAELEALLDEIAARNMKVVTVAEGVAPMDPPPRQLTLRALHAHDGAIACADRRRGPPRGAPQGRPSSCADRPPW